MNNRDVKKAVVGSERRPGGGSHRGHTKPRDLNVDLFGTVTSTDNLFRAWQKFRRSKRSKLDVQIFERKLEENIFNLQYQLKHGQYKHSRYKPFTVFDPKQRQIHKATVRDRLVHQALTQVIEPRFEKSFVYDSFSCRKGKGTHAAIIRLRSMLQQVSSSNSHTIYALKLDIRRFFASVDHTILLELLRRKVNDKPTIQLIEEIVGSFSVSEGSGIPLGNLTSQLLANVYLHELDWYVKQSLKEKYYVRYCDDFIVLSNDRRYLEDLVPVVGGFLKTRLNLTVHPNKIIIRNWNQGIDFLGYVLKPHCTVLRNKTKARMLRNVDNTNITSYLGICSHADSYELQQLINNKVGVEKDELLI